MNSKEQKTTIETPYEAPNLSEVGSVDTLTLGKRRGNWDDGSGLIIKHWVFAY